MINLARRPDRWRHFEASAKAAHVPAYERWEAVDGQHLSLTPELQRLFASNNFFYHKKVMGCALSHYRIWQHIVTHKIEQTIVFEDDCVFLKPFKLPHLPQDWELFYFGGVDLPDIKALIVFPGIPIKKNIIIPKPPANVGMCTYAYMLSLEGAKRLIDRVEIMGFNTAVDWLMVGEFDELKVYCYSPFIAYADPQLGSDIQDKA